jgi:hypothetical protein
VQAGLGLGDEMPADSDSAPVVLFINASLAARAFSSMW